MRRKYIRIDPKRQMIDDFLTNPDKETRISLRR